MTAMLNDRTTSLRAASTPSATQQATRIGRWGAIYALTLCVSTLVASEFMPVSLLTPIATDLHLTEGQAGQAISMSGIFAVVTSLLISSATSRVDRKTLLLCLTALMIGSGAVVALAPNFTVLIAGRALVGVVIGGFWSISAATAMRPGAGSGSASRACRSQWRQCACNHHSRAAWQLLAVYGLAWSIL